MMTVLAILIPLAMGLLISTALIIREGRWTEWALAIFLAPTIGIALTSALYFFWFIIFQPLVGLPYYLALETGLLLLIAALVGIKFRRKIVRPQAPFWKGWLAPRRWNFRTWVGIGGAVVLFVSLANFLEDWLLAFFAQPEGNWDAWSMWNLHARFINSGPLWRTGFTLDMPWWTSPDYPLLLPGFIARVWGLISSQTQYVPAFVELCFLLCILGVVVSSVSLLRGWKLAVFAGLFTLVLLRDSLGYQQYADMPVAFYFLATNLLLWLADSAHKDRPGLLSLAGLMAGAAIWTKNEGWALLLAVGLLEVVKIFVEKPKRSDLLKRWLWFATGFAPLLITALVFKLQLAPPNDVFSHNTPQIILEKISDPSRYAVIWQYITDRFFTLGALKVALLPALVAFVLVVGWNKLDKAQFGTAWIGLRLLVLGLVYFGMYLITPYVITWQLATSFGRVSNQLLPSLILMAFLFMKTLDEASSFSEK
jgi:hypothetical protein